MESSSLFEISVDSIGASILGTPMDPIGISILKSLSRSEIPIDSIGTPIFETLMDPIGFLISKNLSDSIGAPILENPRIGASFASFLSSAKRNYRYVC